MGILPFLLILGSFQGGMMPGPGTPASSGGGGSPTVTTTCASGNAGTMPSITTSTTGAKFIAVGIGSFNGITSIAKSSGDGNATTGIQETGNSPSNGMWYWAAPAHTSGSDTFTITNGGTGYASACVYVVTGVTGVYDQHNGNIASGSSSTCSPGSITPSNSPAAVLVSYATYSASTAPTLNSGYTVGAYANGSAGVAYGEASGYLVQSTAAATNAQWTLANGASTPTCIAISVY